MKSRYPHFSRLGTVIRPLALTLAVLAGGLQVASAQAAAVSLSATPELLTERKSGGSFLDVVNFDIDAGSRLLGSALPLDWANGLDSLLHISGLSLSLYRSDTADFPEQSARRKPSSALRAKKAKKHEDHGLLLGSWSGGPIGFTLPLAAGSYRVTVAGIADGAAGGAYLLGLAALPETVVPSVPEPETWLYLIGGLLALGAVGRRRDRRAPAHPVASTAD